MSKLSRTLPKKRAASVALPEDADIAAAPVTLTMDTFQRALEWLGPKDLGRCTQVCQLWRNHIANSEQSWKQAASNALPVAFQALQAAMPNEDRMMELSYRNMAKGLATIKGQRESDSKAPAFRKPEVKAEDIFLLLELTALGAEGAFCKSLKDCVEQVDATKYHTVCLVDFDSDKPPSIMLQLPQEKIPKLWSSNSGYAVFDGMNNQLSLWRRDTGQSYRIDRDTDECSYIEDLVTPSYCDRGSVGRAFTSVEETRHTSSATSGDFHLEINIYVEPVLPSDGSPEEPEWLRETREDGGGVDSASEQDYGDFPTDGKYRYSSIDVQFCILNEYADYTRASGDEFLLFLEGLAWK